MTTSDARPAVGALHHVAITVSDVEASARWYDKTEPIPYAALVFRDPDNVQLELVHLAS